MNGYSRADTEAFLFAYKKLERIAKEDPILYDWHEKRYGREMELFRSLRNSLAHEEFGGDYPFAVSSLVRSSLESLLSRMEKKCFAYATKNVVYATLATPLGEAIKAMSQKGFSYLPILDAGKRAIGALSANGLLDLMASGANEGIIYDASTKVGEHLAYFSLNGNADERFAFLPRDAAWWKGEDAFANSDAKGRRLGLIFLTEHGKQEEAVIGLLSIYDIMAHKDGESG
jgi:CBS domain-containing protein